MNDHPLLTRTFTISHAGDDTVSSHRARDAAKEAGFSEREAWEIAIAVRELATNILRHTQGGEVRLTQLSDPRPGLEVIAEDRGPGFDDPEKALQDGHSEGRDLATVRPQVGDGLGCGLGAVCRMMDEVTLENREEAGARVRAVRWRERRGGIQ